MIGPGIARSPVGTGGRRWAGLAAATVVAHALPAVTTFGPGRSRLLPCLSGLGDPGHVALTFDDGPDPLSTPRFLDVLDRLGVRATFFVLGEMLVRAPSLGAELAAEGHEVAVHGWDHRSLLLRTPRSTYEGMRRARDLVDGVCGGRPRWFRPPYGVLSAAALVAAGRLGLRPVLWSAWGEDWTVAATPGSVLDTLAPDLRGGATLLLHDSDCTSSPGAWRSALGALPELVDRCRARGVRVGPLAEHGLP